MLGLLVFSGNRAVFEVFGLVVKTTVVVLSKSSNVVVSREVKVGCLVRSPVVLLSVSIVGVGDGSVGEGEFV